MTGKVFGHFAQLGGSSTLAGAVAAVGSTPLVVIGAIAFLLGVVLNSHAVVCLVWGMNARRTYKLVCDSPRELSNNGVEVVRSANPDPRTVALPQPPVEAGAAAVA